MAEAPRGAGARAGSDAPQKASAGKAAKSSPASSPSASVDATSLLADTGPRKFVAPESAATVITSLGPVSAEPAEQPRARVSHHKLPPELDERLILLRDPDSERAASFRVLRHRLTLNGDPRVIAVTSAERHEGKTTCAANLALALSECGRARVLLVEANLRAPSLAGLFGFLPPEFFSEQVARRRDRPADPWSVVEVVAPSLHVLAVRPPRKEEGEAPAQGRPLVDAPAFGLSMGLLRRCSYDYVVVDTPPVLGSADVNLVEDHVDGVLFVTRARISSARALERAVEQLAPVKILGVTLLDA